jgi:hypothetical protein
MNLIITGRGTSGSWKIRGEQLGAAIGAAVQANANKLSGFDLGIVVKRAPADLMHRMRVARLPVVYDVVDGWPQPVGNHEWRRTECMQWLRRQVSEIKPVGIVASTKVMATDCAEFGLPVLALPHHARPGQRRNPIRERVQRVGYEGAPQYLGRWQERIERYCRSKGWEFLMDPAGLDAVDIVVAVRDCAGYAAQKWKSNVKLANAQGSGTPCIVDSEAAYVETATGGEVFVSEPNDVSAAFESLETEEARQKASRQLQTGTLTLERVATEYKQWLTALKF